MYVYIYVYIHTCTYIYIYIYLCTKPRSPCPDSGAAPNLCGETAFPVRDVRAGVTPGAIATTITWHKLSWTQPPHIGALPGTALEL